MINKAVYAGTFDPPTNGHLWMIDKGTEMFDEIVIAIGANPEKKCTFSLSERLDMLRDVTAPYKNAKVDSFENQFLVKYASSVDARFILRGIRNTDDYEKEKTMRHINDDLNSNITTVYLMPPRRLAEISSSAVKGLIGPEGWEEAVKMYVPEQVYRRVLEKFKKPKALC
jgi:pantetheine-phosphate adenylyltransferase